ncbi:hypothetical protein V6N13_029427 [Hibiscus sabdariffa]
MEVSGGREAMKVGKKLIIEYEVSSRKEAPSSGIVTLHVGVDRKVERCYERKSIGTNTREEKENRHGLL